jgi:hypothetical protein
MRHPWSDVPLVVVALVGLAAPAFAQAAPPAGGDIEWGTATPELPVKREEGKAAEGPVEGPEKPQLRELPLWLSKGNAVLIYWAWPDPCEGPGKSGLVWQEKVFGDKEVPPAIRKGEFLCVRMNAKTCPKEVLKQYGVASAPTVQIYTCDGKVAKSWSGPNRDAAGFVAALAAAAARNDALRKAREALRKRLEAEFDRIHALKDAGKLDEARKAYEALAKKHGGDVAEDCRWGLKECRMIEVAREGERLFKEGKYLEAKGRLSVVADFEVPCPARDTARRLMPECDVGVKVQEAEGLAKEGKRLEALEKLQAIVDDQWYDGPMKQVARDKIAALKTAWGNQ